MVEVGIDRVGQMSRQSRMLQPDVAVITAVGSEHQSGLGSLDTTQREKARLLEGLRRPGLAILNGDDPRVRAMAGWTDARVVTYGLGPGNDVRASGVRLEWPRGTRFTLHADGATRELCLQLLGAPWSLPPSPPLPSRPTRGWRSTTWSRRSSGWRRRRGGCRSSPCPIR